MFYEKCGGFGKECRNPVCYCRCAGCVLLGVVALLLGGLVVQLLWNALIPDIFTLGTLTYLQALGLLVLARLLIGGFGCGKRHHRHGGYCGTSKECGDWKHYDAWWETEGKESFKKYAAAKKDEPKAL